MMPVDRSAVFSIAASYVQFFNFFSSCWITILYVNMLAISALQTERKWTMVIICLYMNLLVQRKP